MASPIADFVVDMGPDGRIVSQGSLSNALAHDAKLMKELQQEQEEMEKTKKEQAIKKLQAELKDEKLAEIQRCALSSHHPSSLPRHRLPNFSISFPTDVAACSFPIQTEGDHHGAQDGR